MRRPQSIKYRQMFSSILMFKYVNDTFANIRRSQVQKFLFCSVLFFSRKKKKLPTAIKTKHTVSMLSGTKPSLNKSTDDI